MVGHFGGVGGRHRAHQSKNVMVVMLLTVMVLCGLGAFTLLSSSTPSVATEPAKVDAPQIEVVDVLVPAQKIEAGQPLDPIMFKKESRPKVGLSPGAIRDYEEIKGYFARSLITPDQPLHKDFITNIKPTNTITANIPEGYRAVTIRVDATSSVEGWARAGAHVDVNWSSNMRGKPAVTTIVQNAQILSAERNAGENTDPAAAVPSTVTLLVSANDAAKIMLAMSAGSLNLSLRGDRDSKHSEGTTQTITFEDLYNGGEQTAGEEPNEGTVRMGGKEWVVRNGKLVPKG